MEPKKYWFISLQFKEGNSISNLCSVVDVHPFIELKKCMTLYKECTLTNWKLISAEEYNLFTELFQEATC